MDIHYASDLNKAQQKFNWISLGWSHNIHLIPFGGVGEAEQIHVSIADLGNLLNPFRDFDLIFSWKIIYSDSDNTYPTYWLDLMGFQTFSIEIRSETIFSLHFAIFIW